VNGPHTSDLGLAWLGALPWCVGILLPQYYTVLFGTGLLVFLWLAATRWRDALALIIFLSPLARLIRAANVSDPVLASFEEVMVAILMCTYVLGPARLKRVRLPAPIVASLAITIVLIVLQGARSGSLAEAVLRLREHCRYLPLALLVGYSVVHKRVCPRDVLWWIGAAGVGVCAFQLLFSYTDWQPFLSPFLRTAKVTEQTRYVAGWPLRRSVPVTYGGPSALCNVVCPAAVVWCVLAFEKGRGRSVAIATALALIGTAALTVSFSLSLGLLCAAACVLWAMLLASLGATGKGLRLGSALFLVLVAAALNVVGVGSERLGDAPVTSIERARSDKSVYTRHFAFPNVSAALLGQGFDIVGGEGWKPNKPSAYKESLVDSGWSGLFPQLGIPVSMWVLFTVGLIVWMAVKAAAASFLEQAHGKRPDLTRLAACGALGACFGSVHVLPWQNFAGLDVIFVTLMGLVIGLSAKQLQTRARPVSTGSDSVDRVNPVVPLTDRGSLRPLTRS